MLFGRTCMILELHDKGQALRDGVARYIEREQCVKLYVIFIIFVYFSTIVRPARILNPRSTFAAAPRSAIIAVNHLATRYRVE